MATVGVRLGECVAELMLWADGPDTVHLLPSVGPDPSVLSHVLEGHGDAVWGLAFSLTSQRLASCSADGTVRIWDPSSSSPACLCTFPTASGEWAEGTVETLTPHSGAIQRWRPCEEGDACTPVPGQDPSVRQPSLPSTLRSQDPNLSGLHQHRACPHRGLLLLW